MALSYLILLLPPLINLYLELLGDPVGLLQHIGQYPILTLTIVATSITLMSLYIIHLLKTRRGHHFPIPLAIGLVSSVCLRVGPFWMVYITTLLVHRWQDPLLEFIKKWLHRWLVGTPASAPILPLYTRPPPPPNPEIVIDVSEPGN